jgi:hypothetical protein
MKLSKQSKVINFIIYSQKMKSIVLALFLGVISANQQHVESLVALQDIAAPHKDDGIIDALTSKSCEDRLWLSQDELDW